jgi:hypothetical protein
MKMIMLFLTFVFLSACDAIPQPDQIPYIEVVLHNNLGVMIEPINDIDHSNNSQQHPEDWFKLYLSDDSGEKYVYNVTAPLANGGYSQSILYLQKNSYTLYASIPGTDPIQYNRIDTNMQSVSFSYRAQYVIELNKVSGQDYDLDDDGYFDNYNSLVSTNVLVLPYADN